MEFSAETLRGKCREFSCVRDGENYIVVDTTTTRGPAQKKSSIDMFYLIGLGLGDPKDITVKGLEIVKQCARVYLEMYTSILGCPKEELVSSDLFSDTALWSNACHL